MKITKKKKSFVVKTSTPIINNAHILNWLVKYQQNAFKTATHNLSRNLYDELNRNFGEQTARFMGKHLTSIWVLTYGDLLFNVYTALGKGTSIEICNYSHEDINKGVKQDEIIEFLTELGKVINT